MSTCASTLRVLTQHKHASSYKLASALAAALAVVLCSVGAAAQTAAAAARPAPGRTAKSAPATRAPEPAPIVLVRSPEFERTLAPLRAELGMLGFRLVVTDVEETDAGLGGVGQRTGALAVIQVVAPHRAELWLSPATTNGSAENQAVSGADDRAFAVRVVELLHARWAEIALPEADNAGSGATDAHEATEPPPRPADSRRKESSPLLSPPHDVAPQLWLDAAIGAVSSSDGLGTTPTAILGATYRAPRLLELDLFGALPVMPVQLSAPEGTAKVRVWVLGLTLGPRLTLGSWAVHFGGGPMLSWVQVQGDARAPYVSQKDSARVRGAQLRASVDVRLARSLKLTAGGRLGLGFEEARVVIAERSAAQFGLPFVLADLGLSWGLL